jgi:hypothetical protein
MTDLALCVLLVGLAWRSSGEEKADPYEDDGGGWFLAAGGGRTEEGKADPYQDDGGGGASVISALRKYEDTTSADAGFLSGNAASE